MCVYVCVWLCGCSFAQSCLILRDLMDYSPPGSPVHGIFQERILEWAAFPTTGDLSDPGIKPMSLVFPALAGGFFTTVPPGKPYKCRLWYNSVTVKKQAPLQDISSLYSRRSSCCLLYSMVNWCLLSLEIEILVMGVSWPISPPTQFLFQKS